MTIKAYRRELKYIITNQELSLLKSQLSELMEMDSHTPEKQEKYLVHSLYFDDYKDTSANATGAGLSNRYKWRIRYYGNDLSYIVLEEKLENRRYKESCKITIDEYNKIVLGEYEELIFDLDKKLIKELAVDMMIHNYKPKIIIDYERIAYVEEITNVRITFDTKISASYDLENFLDGDYQSFYILPNNINILEIKFENILPSYIRRIIESYNLKRYAFSKYYSGRKIMDYYIR